jgi:hypothetical protein
MMKENENLIIEHFESRHPKNKSDLKLEVYLELKCSEYNLIGLANKIKEMAIFPELKILENQNDSNNGLSNYLFLSFLIFSILKVTSFM